LITPSPFAYTNCYANYLLLSALKTNLEMRVIPCGILSVFKYFKAFRVKYIISALARPAQISSTSFSYIY
jgi:hypothetical protein